VEARDQRLCLDFPSRPPQPAAAARARVSEALGRAPSLLFASRDYLAVFDSEAEVRALQPDMAKAAALERLGVIATAPGLDCDFVSRFFAPGAGVPEDPVTGSAHCTLVPYWAKRLGKTSLFARQVSKRGGELWCEDRGDRVSIAGHAVKFLEGVIEL
jgi:predicted PhzF superfamily epimerase YddE/YHI9